MQVNLSAKKLTITDDKETVEFHHSQRATIAHLLKQQLGLKV